VEMRHQEVRLVRTVQARFRVPCWCTGTLIARSIGAVLLFAFIVLAVVHTSSRAAVAVEKIVTYSEEWGAEVHDVNVQRWLWVTITTWSRPAYFRAPGIRLGHSPEELRSIRSSQTALAVANRL